MMQKNTRSLIREINKGKNLGENGLLYREKLTDVYGGLSLIQLSMNYYILYEKLLEESNAGRQKDTVLKTIRNVVEECILEEAEKPGLKAGIISKGIKRLLDEREGIIARMKVLTAYIDRLLNLEYVLNRKELCFGEKSVSEMEDEVFIQKVMEYIFSERDQMVINEKIREVVSQLPVRMTKQRYFELLRESLTVYKGGGQDALETFLYMIRTSGMVYSFDGMEQYAGDYQNRMDYLEGLSFESLSEEEYGNAIGELNRLAADFREESDWYVGLTEVLNGLLVYLMAQKYRQVETIGSFPFEKTAYGILREINQMQKNCLGANPEESGFDALAGKFGQFEGIQEELAEEKNLLEAVLSKTVFDGMQGQETAFLEFSQMAKLLSTSYFAELTEEEVKTVDSEYLNQVSKELTEELSAFFQSHERCLNRAVMAGTLNKMPVFFKTPDEIRQYVAYSLKQCTDYSEKEISKRLVLSLAEC